MPNHWKTISERFTDLRRQLHLRVVLVHHAPDGPAFPFPPPGADGGFATYHAMEREGDGWRRRRTLYIAALNAVPGWTKQLEDVAAAAGRLLPAVDEAGGRWTNAGGRWWSHVFAAAWRGDNPLLRARRYAWTVARGEALMSWEIGADASPPTWWSDLDDALASGGVVADAMAEGDVVPQGGGGDEARDVVPAVRVKAAEARTAAENYVRLHPWPGVNALAKIIGCSSATVRKAVKESAVLQCAAAKAKLASGADYAVDTTVADVALQRLIEHASPSDRASLNAPEMRSQLERMAPEALRELVRDYEKDHKNRMAAKHRARARTPVDS